MIGRSEIGQDSTVKFVRENFVPVALGFLNGGGGNSHSVQTPSGEKLPGEPHQALKAWKDLAPGDRSKVTLPDLNPPKLPEGGLAIRVLMRALRRSADGAAVPVTDRDIRENPKLYPQWVIDPSEKRFPVRLYAEPMGDVLWLTQAEVRSLVPADPKAGATFPLPDPVAKRIVRMHLKNGTQGWLGWWGKEHIRSEKLALRIEKASPTIVMTLEGAVLLATEADPAQAKMGYDAKLSGRLEYDPAKKTFTRFDLLAIGDLWGPPNEFSRPGRHPMGVAFELTRGDHPMDQAYPFALYAPGKDAYFRAESVK